MLYADLIFALDLDDSQVSIALAAIDRLKISGLDFSRFVVFLCLLRLSLGQMLRAFQEKKRTPSRQRTGHRTKHFSYVLASGRRESAHFFGTASRKSATCPIPDIFDPRSH
jgi:hypothetical protein